MNAQDFLVKDYEIKARYLTDHFQRTWTGFNFSVTTQSALINVAIGTALRIVGETEKTAHDLQQDDSANSFFIRVVERLSGWRLEPISTTKLASLFPLFVSFVWIAVLVFGSK